MKRSGKKALWARGSRWQGWAAGIGLCDAEPPYRALSSPFCAWWFIVSYIDCRFCSTSERVAKMGMIHRRILGW